MPFLHDDACSTCSDVIGAVSEYGLHAHVHKTSSKLNPTDALLMQLLTESSRAAEACVTWLSCAQPRHLLVALDNVPDAKDKHAMSLPTFCDSVHHFAKGCQGCVPYDWCSLTPAYSC